MRIQSIIATIIFAALMAGSATAAGISGKVTSKESGEALGGVVVKIKGSDIRMVTGSDGRFSIESDLAGKFTLVASVIGYNVAYQPVFMGSTEPVEISLVPELLKGQDVIVTATRATEGQTPVAFTNVSNDDIAEKYLAQDVPMLLADNPNMFAYSDAGNGVGYSYLKIRGFGQNRVAVMLNGAPLNDAESGEVFWIDLPDFAESVQDIQIQRGVGNSLYGASALGGSINLVTTDYSIVPQLKFKSGYGSYNTKKLLLSGNSGLMKDSYVFYGRFSKIDTDGYRDKSWSKMWGYFVGMARYGERSTTKLNIYGGPEESHLAYKGITAEQLDTDRKYNPLQYNDEIDHFNQPHYEIINDYVINEKTSISNTLYLFQGNGYYDQFRADRNFAEYNLGATYDPNTWITYAVTDTTFPRDYYLLRDPLGNPMVDSTGMYPLDIDATDLVRRRAVSEYDWGWIPRVTYDLGKGAVVAGGEIRLHRAHHSGEVIWAGTYPQFQAPNIRYYDYIGTRNSYTAFGHIDYEFIPKLTGMLDLQLQTYRYEMSDDKRFNIGFTRDYSFITPRAGLNYRFNDNISAFANVSTAARQPGFKDIYDPTDFWSNPAFKPDNFTVIGGGYIFDGKDIKPEKLFDIELGGKYSRDFSGNKLDLTCNLYRMQVTDEIIPYAGQVDDNGYPISGNASKTLHQGVELALKAATKINLVISGNVAINDDHFVDYIEYGFDWDLYQAVPMVRDGNRIGGFPSILAGYGATYRYKMISAGVFGRFIGEQYLDNSESASAKLKSYHLLDLTASYDFGDEFGLGRTAFVFRVNNVLDTKYSAAGYIEPDDGLPRYMVGAERNFYLSLELGI